MNSPRSQEPYSQVLIAANPKSGASSNRGRVSELQQALTGTGLACHIHTSLEELRQAALQADARGELKAIVAAGGDGTVGALANLLPSHIPLLIFPLGTENLLAKHLGIHGDIAQARQILLSQQRLMLDVGRANGKLFLVMLSCGFDAEVVRHMHALRTGHINRWSYARPIITSLRGYRFPQLQYSLPAQAASSMPVSPTTAGRSTSRSAPLAQANSAAWLFVFNVPRYAAALNFCPQADPTDGLLDVCSFKRSGTWAGLGYLARLWLGSHQRMAGFEHRLCQRLEIAAPLDRHGEIMQVPFQIDGDPGGLLPLQIELLPQRLTLLIPATGARS